MPGYYFDHIHLRSLDAGKTAEFYEQMFGAKRISARDEKGVITNVKLDLNGVTILINRVEEGAETGLVHFGIRTDNLEESVKTMKDRGVEFTMDIRQVRPDFKISFLNAPEGVSIELQEGSL